MALTEKQIEEKKQRLLGDPEFMAKLRARLEGRPTYGSLEHRANCEVLDELKQERGLREDFEALATVAWGLVQYFAPASEKEFNAEQKDAYHILKDYFESEEEEDDE